MIRRLALGAAALWLAVGCSSGRRAVQAPPPATTTTLPASTTTLPASTTTTAAPAGTTAVGEADSGRTVRLRVGQHLALTLDGSGLQWSGLKVEPAGILRSDPAPAPPPHGLAASFTAVAAGTAQVSATGTAWCPPGQACPMFARPFGVTVVVS